MSDEPFSWNRLRYTLWAPAYDLLVAPLQALGFRKARARALALMDPTPGARVLLVGCGTGLDLELLPEGLDVTATDLVPGMVERTRRRAERLGRSVEARVMDGSQMPLPDDSFDHVVLHLILAVMPEPEACAREVARVLRPGGTVSIFDKFVPDGEEPSLLRRLANVPASLVATELTRSLGAILDAGDLEVRHHEWALGGLFTVASAAHR